MSIRCNHFAVFREQKRKQKKNPDPFFTSCFTEVSSLEIWWITFIVEKALKTLLKLEMHIKMYIMDFTSANHFNHFWKMEMCLRHWKCSVAKKKSSCFNILTIKWYNIYTIFLSSDFAWEFRLNFEAIGANEQNWRRKSKRARAGKTNSFDLRDIEKKQEWNEFPEKPKHSKNFSANLNAEQID